MTTAVSALDPVFQKFPEIGGEARKIRIALAAQEAGAQLKSGFSTYAVACHNLAIKSAPLRTLHKDLDAALQVLSARVATAYSKIAPSELLQAICSNDPKMVDKILKISDMRNLKLSNGELPLHYAIRAGKTSLVKYFLENHVDPALKDHQGCTAFDHAFISNDPKMIALVLGASLGSTISEKALAGKVDTAEWQKMALDVRELRMPRVTDLHPLHQAAFMGDLVELEKLKKQKVNLNGFDLSGMTALHFAALGGHEDAVRWLLKNGVKADAKAANGMTLLHMAAISGSAPILKRVLDAQKFDLNIPDALGRTPLHLALACTHLDAARLLVEKGANPLVASMRTTPLSIFKVLTEQRSQNRDRLALDKSAAMTFGLFAASLASQYYGNESLAKLFSALPVLAKIVAKSRNGPMWQRVAATLGMSYTMSSYLFDDRIGKSLCQGANTASLGKTFWDQLRISWANSAFETYRPIRNVFIHGANALFSGLEFMYTSDLKKRLVCTLGSANQCLLQKEVNPTCPLSEARTSFVDKEIEKVKGTMEQSCKKTLKIDPATCLEEKIQAKTQELHKQFTNNAIQPSLDAICKNDMACRRTQEQSLGAEFAKKMTSCIQNAQSDAELVLGFGGYPAATPNAAYRKLALRYHADKCKNLMPVDSCNSIFGKITSAKNTLEAAATI